MTELSELTERLACTLGFLPDKPEETAQSTARALWFAAAGMPRSAQLANEGDLPALDGPAAARLAKLVERRIQGEPLAHLTGWQHFMGLELIAGSDALVPRRETEILAGEAVRLARDAVGRSGSARVVDVCTGSGNVALAIASQVPEARVWGADLSAEAAMLAGRNAERLNLDDRVRFMTGDLLAPFDEPGFLGQVDVLTCNPPYINSAKVGTLPREISAFEPRLAFDGGTLGISILMRLLSQAPRFLRARGWLAFEVGLGQGPALIRRLGGLKDYSRIGAVNDANGAVRVVCVQRADEGPP